MCACPVSVHICVFAFKEAFGGERQTSQSFSFCPLPLPIHVKNQSRVKTCLNFPCLCDYSVTEFDRSVRHGGVSQPFGMPCASGALETACQTPMSRWRSQGPYGAPDGPLR